MPFLDLSRWDPAALAAQWAAAQPFPHLVVDDLLADEQVNELRQSVAREPHSPNMQDFYEMMASGLPMQQDTLRRFEAEMGATATRAFLRAVTGKASFRVEMRSYVYLAGSYLLPHSDSRDGMGRMLAYAYYLVGSENSVGGELELFACRVEGGEIVATESACRIEPRANRLVVFDVSPVSLHQVREVTQGGRASLSGWYFG